MVMNEDIHNNLAFFKCSSCGEDLIVTVNKASVIKTINPNWMNDQMEKEVIVTAKNHIILQNSIYDDMIRSFIIHVLKQTNGNLTHAAKLSGKCIDWFRDNMEKYGIINVWSENYKRKRKEKGNVELNLGKACRKYEGKK